MFSVVVPLYNKEESIKRTLESVLEQKYQNFELIVVNDGSTDGSAEVVNGMQDERIRLINKVNGGVSSARNLGIKEAKYDWIALLDGDDLWAENHLYNMHKAIVHNPEIQFLGAGYNVAKKDGTLLHTVQAEKEGLVNFFEISLKIRFVVNSSCVAFNKVKYPGVYFDENLTAGEDLNFLEKLGKSSPLYLIPEATSFYLDDTENKAVYSTHSLDKTHVYNINTEDIRDAREKKYYNNLILHSSLQVLEGSQSAKNAWKIYQKHNRFIGDKRFL